MEVPMKSKRKQQQSQEIEAMHLNENGEIVIEEKEEEKPKQFTYDDYVKVRAKRIKKQPMIRSSHR